MNSSPADPFPERPKGRGEVVCREVDDGFILYDPEEGRVHSLNLAAAFIWDSLDGTQSLAEISGNLRKIPGTEGHDVSADVLKTVTNFREEGLLE
jgi:hypothetical protein